MTIDTMSLMTSCIVICSLILALRGEAIHPFFTGVLIAGPFSYMVSHDVPTMNTVFGQWALAIMIIGGSPLVGVVVLTRRLMPRVAI